MYCYLTLLPFVEIPLKEDPVHHYGIGKKITLCHKYTNHIIDIHKLFKITNT